MAKIDEIMKKGGEDVSIFDLNELIGKFLPLNQLNMKVIDNLKPFKFDYL